MRTRKGAATRQAKKRLMRRAKGFWGGRRRLLRTVKEAVIRAGVYAYRDRRKRKRDFRRLWIIRLSAACAAHGMRYSQFICGLKKAGITLDRKSLSELAIHDPAGFKSVLDQAREALAV